MLDEKMDIAHFINDKTHKLNILSVGLRCGVQLTYMIILDPMWMTLNGSMKDPLCRKSS